MAQNAAPNGAAFFTTANTAAMTTALTTALTTVLTSVIPPTLVASSVEPITTSLSITPVINLATTGSTAESPLPNTIVPTTVSANRAAVVPSASETTIPTAISSSVIPTTSVPPPTLSVATTTTPLTTAMTTVPTTTIPQTTVATLPTTTHTTTQQQPVHVLGADTSSTTTSTSSIPPTTLSVIASSSSSSSSSSSLPSSTTISSTSTSSSSVTMIAAGPTSSTTTRSASLSSSAITLQTSNTPTTIQSTEAVTTTSPSTTQITTTLDTTPTVLATTSIHTTARNGVSSNDHASGSGESALEQKVGGMPVYGIVLLVLGILVCLIGGYFGYRYFGKKRFNDDDDTDDSFDQFGGYRGEKLNDDDPDHPNDDHHHQQQDHEPNLDHAPDARYAALPGALNRFLWSRKNHNNAQRQSASTFHALGPSAAALPDTTAGVGVGEGVGGGGNWNKYTSWLQAPPTAATGRGHDVGYPEQWYGGQGDMIGVGTTPVEPLGGYGRNQRAFETAVPPPPPPPEYHPQQAQSKSMGKINTTNLFKSNPSAVPLSPSIYSAYPSNQKTPQTSSNDHLAPPLAALISRVAAGNSIDSNNRQDGSNITRGTSYTVGGESDYDSMFGDAGTPMPTSAFSRNSSTVLPYRNREERSDSMASSTIGGGSVYDSHFVHSGSIPPLPRLPIGAFEGGHTQHQGGQPERVPATTTTTTSRLEQAKKSITNRFSRSGGTEKAPLLVRNGSSSSSSAAAAGRRRPRDDNDGGGGGNNEGIQEVRAPPKPLFAQTPMGMKKNEGGPMPLGWRSR